MMMMIEGDLKLMTDEGAELNQQKEIAMASHAARVIWKPTMKTLYLNIGTDDKAIQKPILENQIGVERWIWSARRKSMKVNLSYRAFIQQSS